MTKISRVQPPVEQKTAKSRLPLNRLGEAKVLNEQLGQPMRGSLAFPDQKASKAFR